jgi:VIT1/CCC1 family predicted Fe2+/Mn2+ transporter
MGIRHNDWHDSYEQSQVKQRMGQRSHRETVWLYVLATIAVVTAVLMIVSFGIFHAEWGLLPAVVFSVSSALAMSLYYERVGWKRSFWAWIICWVVVLAAAIVTALIGR